MLLAETLDELGYTAIEAHTGAAALQVLQSDTPRELLVANLGLPGGVHGSQVVEAEWTARPELKVFFIKGYSDNAAVA